MKRMLYEIGVPCGRDKYNEVNTARFRSLHATATWLDHIDLKDTCSSSRSIHVVAGEESAVKN